MDTGTPDLLLEEESGIVYEYATTGQRFLNYFIDNLLMRFGLTYASGAALGYLIATISPDLAYELFYNDESKFLLYVFAYLVVILNYIFYYSVCEKLFKGYTLGKLITGTRAIKEDGDELTFRDALLRSLSRIVPFEPFSGFGGHPWHDTWTKTIVVKAR